MQISSATRPDLSLMRTAQPPVAGLSRCSRSGEARLDPWRSWQSALLPLRLLSRSPVSGALPLVQLSANCQGNDAGEESSPACSKLPLNEALPVAEASVDGTRRSVLVCRLRVFAMYSVCTVLRIVAET